MPSIVDLFWVLVDLAWAVAAYYLGLGPWDDVSKQWYKLRDWFNDLYDAIYAAASSAYDQAISYLWPTIQWLIDWKDYLNAQVNIFRWWVDNRLTWMFDWLNWGYKALEWYVQTAYSGVYWLINTAYGYILWLTNTFYSYGVWLISTAYSYLEWYRQTFYSYAVWFKNSFYSYAVWLLDTARSYLVWLTNTFYSYGVWLINTAYGYIEWYRQTFYSYAVWFKNVGYGMLKALEAINLNGLIAFARDAMGYWYNTWSFYGPKLSAFLANPSGFVLASIRDYFLDWFEQLIAENW